MNLAKLRKAKGLTQAKLAELSGVNKRMIEHYEIGYKDIHKVQGFTLYKLALVLDCKIEDLLEDDKKESAKKAIEIKSKE